MKRAVLLDTGPLVALLNRRDRHHEWAGVQWQEIEPPLLTCEAVLVEACYLVRRLQEGPETVLELVRRGAIAIRFSLEQECSVVSRLLARYADRPMSLADACLVRMAEQHGGSHVLTVDSDFRAYRKHGRQVIPTLMPDRP